MIPVDLQPGANKIQQLEVWNPGELEQHILMWVIISNSLVIVVL